MLVDDRLNIFQNMNFIYQREDQYFVPFPKIFQLPHAHSL